MIVLTLLFACTARAFLGGSSLAPPSSPVAVVARDVVVVGSGPSGCTAATYLARAQLKPLLISGYESGGQLMLTGDIENFPGHQRVSGPQFMDSLLEQAASFGTDIWKVDCLGADFQESKFRLRLPNCTVEAKAVIIATGAGAKWLHAPNEEKYRGNGISTCATCDGFLYRGKRVAVIGGGDSAMEEALHLSRLAREVFLVHRGESLRASKIMIKRVKSVPNIVILLNRHVVRWTGEENTLTGAVLLNKLNASEESIRFEGAFLAIGHTPNSKVFDGTSLKMDRDGYILTETGSLMTNINGIFACGDIVDKKYRQAVTAAGMGCQAALEAEKWLNGLGHVPDGRFDTVIRNDGHTNSNRLYARPFWRGFRNIFSKRF